MLIRVTSDQKGLLPYLMRYIRNFLEGLAGVLSLVNFYDVFKEGILTPAHVGTNKSVPKSDTPSTVTALLHELINPESTHTHCTHTSACTIYTPAAQGNEIRNTSPTGTVFK